MNTNRLYRVKRVALLLASSAVLAACGGSGSDDNTGRLSLGVVDAPVDDAQHVYVQFSGIELHGPDGSVSVDFAAPKQLDLLALTGTNDAPLLSSYELTAGDYQWIRLKVDTNGALDSYLVDSNGLSHELTIPSGDETGLKLNRGFTLAQGGVADFTIDFDLRHSVIEDGTGYKLKPTLRLVDNVVVGSVSGNVATDLVTAHCAANQYGAVYVFAGANVTPDDVDGDAGDPITSALVADDGTNAYQVGFLAAGNYTVSWTCDAGLDLAETGETLAFFGTANVVIAANQNTVLNFAP